MINNIFIVILILMLILADHEVVVMGYAAPMALDAR